MLATDTLYGLVARALDKKAVTRIYKLKQRQPQKPFIILIANTGDLAQFGIEPLAGLEKYWPGPTSIILPCTDTGLAYLHRGTKSLAFRLPAKPSLRRLIKATGPLVAPSANPEGLPPARTITEAKAYFADSVDFYQPGRTTAKPSKLIRINNSKIEILRN